MLDPGRLTLSRAESEAIDRLLASHAGKAVSLTRRDPGETGPVLVHMADDTYHQVSAAGRIKWLKEMV